MLDSIYLMDQGRRETRHFLDHPTTKVPVGILPDFLPND
jgi:hypothetical protein